MTRRAEIFSSDSIPTLVENNPFLRLFQKETWEEYLELIAQIYDLLEGRGGRIEQLEVSQLIDRFYFKKDLKAPELKGALVLSMFISELKVLRDGHDSLGNRFIESTREGKQFLRICERLIQNRPSYTGAGAEALVSNLNLILRDPKETSIEDAIKSHDEVIQRYKEDIKRIKSHGVQASELLNPGFSIDELFQAADEEAGSILAAAEDVKLAIEAARKDLIKQYHDRHFTAGKAIEFIADFHEALRNRPEYQSYIRAKDILSHIEGLGSSFRNRDIEDMFQSLLNKELLPKHVLNRSSISQFSRQFQSLGRSIEEKTQEQIQLLRVQVHYVVTGDSRKTREDLGELQGTFFKVGPEVMDFISTLEFSVPDGLGVEVGVLTPHSLELPELIQAASMERNSFDLGDQGAIVEFLKKAEEATVEQVLRKLQTEIDQQGEVLLSHYSITLGIVEYYVLSLISCFSEVITSVEEGRTDLTWTNSDRRVSIQNIPNYRYSFN